jgi:hypothetical protein
MISDPTLGIILVRSVEYIPRLVSGGVIYKSVCGNYCGQICKIDQIYLKVLDEVRHLCWAGSDEPCAYLSSSKNCLGKQFGEISEIDQIYLKVLGQVSY